mgnify:CR=1 FL=1
MATITLDDANVEELLNILKSRPLRPVLLDIIEEQLAADAAPKKTKAKADPIAE